ncbi:hypothetical protein FEM48_Zijuj02G0124300 [Ziziphus jujuba var. spinosa]|uniref:Uncharacterized protein n=1 Tax=Ziziphus jujuba var. spinosa TaxID=714518 RepID=A0A978VVQ6_ZIZJJ|nr:hypothetical protein FEM48_Zijuj02G0124300 [Ziziphus jujuba var. spinosa]
MAQMVGEDEIESLRIELAEIGRSLRSSFQHHTLSFRTGASALSSAKDDTDVEYALQWAAIERCSFIICAISGLYLSSSLFYRIHSRVSVFRFLASVFSSIVASMTTANFAMLLLLFSDGFLIPEPAMPVWLKWGFWISPPTYGEISLYLNEFLAPRLQKMMCSNTTIGQQTLDGHGLNFNKYLYWISLVTLFSVTVVFNIRFTPALTFLTSKSRSSKWQNKELAKQLSTPPQGSTDLHFLSRFSQKIFGTIQMLLMEAAALIILEVSLMQPDSCDEHTYIILDIWGTLLEQGKEHVMVEVPYIITQTVICVVITYPLTGYALVLKVSWLLLCHVLFTAVLQYYGNASSLIDTKLLFSSHLLKSLSS